MTPCFKFLWWVFFLGVALAAAQPSSNGKPTMPPSPIYLAQAETAPPQPPRSYVIETQTVLIPTGKWRVVCQNFECGATNNVLPVKTNTIVIPGLGGRSVQRWLFVQCPACSLKFTNLFEERWIVDVPPIPVMIRTNAVK